MRMWVLLPGLIVLVALGFFVALTLRWDVHWENFSFAGTSDIRGLAEFGRMVVAASLFPAVLLFAALKAGIRKLKWPSARSLWVVAVIGFPLTLWGGILPFLKRDPSVQAGLHLQAIEEELEQQLSQLCKAGRYAEAVTTMEGALEAKEDVIALDGLSRRDCGIGFSYLFVSLYPTSSDLTSRLGDSLTYFLFDRWHDPGQRRVATVIGAPGAATELVWDTDKDPLVPAMRESRHPLLRGIGHWLARDYQAFEAEALAGAEQGDERMDALALVAACALGDDRAEALQKVEPILQRGVGLGWDWSRGGGYSIPAARIRDYLEGRITRRDLRGHFIYPPGLQQDP